MATWARLATKSEYQAYHQVAGTSGMVLDVITNALAAAADDAGLLPALNLPALYTTHVARLLCTPDAEVPGFRELTYDAFAAVALLEGLNMLLAVGVLAEAEEGYDYHLAVPTAPPGKEAGGAGRGTGE